MTTGTSSPAYSIFSEKDPSSPSTILQYQTITATPAYRGTSLEVCDLIAFFSFGAILKHRGSGIALARLSTKPQDSWCIWPNVIWSSRCTTNWYFWGTGCDPTAYDWVDIRGRNYWSIWPFNNSTCYDGIWTVWATTTDPRHQYRHGYLWPSVYVWPAPTATTCRIWCLWSVSTTATRRKHWY